MHPFLGAAAATWVTPTPLVTMYPNTSNVFGRAHAGQDVGVVRSLGTFNTTAACQAACLAYVGKDGASCNSFSFHDPTFRTPFNGACFAVADHSWSPTPSDSGPSITSGRVAWPRASCGGAAAAPGCEWQLDPRCASPSAALSPPRCCGRSGSRARRSSARPTASAWALRTRARAKQLLDERRTPTGRCCGRGSTTSFWQWNPTALVGFANMHWGHAVSHDLLGWTQLPVALYPDSGA